jgi:copper chaperone
LSTATHTFRIEGMHCGSCALLIDDTLTDLPGVRSTRTSMKESRCIVELDLVRCAPADVVAAVGELGYTARHQP